MRFIVEKLGPIERAEVDLSRELIVLAGPNNSGKTYFAWAVYGFERFELTQELPSVGPVADALLARPSERADLAALLETGNFLVEAARFYSGALVDEFAGERAYFTSAQVKVEGVFRGPRWATDVAFPVGTRLGRVFMAEDYVARLRVTPPGNSPVRAIDPADEEPPLLVEDLTAEEQERLRANLGFVLSYEILRASRDWTVTAVFPVERIAINTFAKELTENRTGWADQFRNVADVGSSEDLRREVLSKVDRYPRAIRDALHDATRLDRFKRRTSPLADLADELESTVLGGKVNLSEDNVLEFTPDRSTTTHLRIQQTASVVKSLASLVFYLRHRARGDERLIIDEPELNLHPDNQRKVARVLAKLVNRGIQLIISTHSDYVIRELNNLIMLSQDSDAARETAKELGIQPEMTLRPAQLGVYLFGADGTCEEVEVSDTGFEVETIDREIHKMNQDAQTIYSRLFLDE